MRRPNPIRPEAATGMSRAPGDARARRPRRRGARGATPPTSVLVVPALLLVIVVPSSRAVPYLVGVTRPSIPVILVAALACVGAGGCFPYGEPYRPEVNGRVVDLDDAPIPGARVEACSENGWTGLQGGCPRRVTTTTAADGRFHFDRKKEVEWCCFGEAPLPFTLVSVCAPDGRLGGAIFDSSRDPANLTIPVRPPASLQIGQNGSVTGGAAQVSHEREVRALCGAPRSDGAPR